MAVGSASSSSAGRSSSRGSAGRAESRSRSRSSSSSDSGSSVSTGSRGRNAGRASRASDSESTPSVGSRGRNAGRANRSTDTTEATPSTGSRARRDARETRGFQDSTEVSLSAEAQQAMRNEVEMQDSLQAAEDAREAKESNPYDGVAEAAAEKTVEAYDPETGKGTIDGMLKEQGYTDADIYTPDSNGKTLVDRVAEVNDLKNPNLIEAGQNLQIPVREVAEAEAAPEETVLETVELEPMTAEELANLSPEELTARALQGRELAMGQTSEMFDAVSGLPEEMRTAALQSMRGSIAANSGIMGEGYTAEQFAGAETRMSAEDLETYKSMVAEYAGNNPMQSQIYMSGGARDWAVSQMDNTELSDEQHLAVETIGFNGNSAVGNNQMSVDAAYELFTRDEEAGRALMEQLNGMGQ